MRPFLIDDEVKLKLADLVKYADEHIVTVEQNDEIGAGKRVPVGDTPGHRCYLPFGYKVVLSLEQQPKAFVRHLSVSVDTIRKLPAVIVVEEIMRLTGFERELLNCIIRFEDIAPDHLAINVMEIMSTPKEKGVPGKSVDDKQSRHNKD